MQTKTSSDGLFVFLAALQYNTLSKQEPPTFRNHLHNVEVAHQECSDLKLIQAAAVWHAAPRGASADLTRHRRHTEASGSGCLGCTWARAQQIQHIPDTAACLLSPACATPSAPCVTRFGDISIFEAAANAGVGSLEILDAQPKPSSPRKKCLGREWWLIQQNARQSYFHFCSLEHLGSMFLKSVFIK